ncbi:LysR family transcriptional regulator [Buttiauxella sp.]|uniref:LysR family transcriptional regulator n=1 Tax=Buttiauxella sp. TaxID=1972222 RepID=UPI003C722CBE
MVEKHDFEHLINIDLNSVLYFSAVMNYKTIFNASVVMKCSPPTVSIMLKRFCSYFPVPLFEREGRCLKPTKYAIELHKMLSELFSKFSCAVSAKSAETELEPTP